MSRHSPQASQEKWAHSSMRPRRLIMQSCPTVGRWLGHVYDNVKSRCFLAQPFRGHIPQMYLQKCIEVEAQARALHKRVGQQRETSAHRGPSSKRRCSHAKRLQQRTEKLFSCCYGEIQRCVFSKIKQGAKRCIYEYICVYEKSVCKYGLWHSLPGCVLLLCHLPTV